MKRPDWMTEQAWRTIRTAAQVFLGVFAASLLAVVQGYAKTHALDLEALWYQGVVLGVAAVISWAMNAPK